jgi:glycosyltransferase involved in cell wall biosynthesis
MHLAVFSHKLCWPSNGSSATYVTDGGFPLQMEAISELFSSTNIVVPCESSGELVGLSPLDGKNLNVVPLSVPRGKGFQRKLDMARWLFKNGWIILSEVRRADAVHSPIPGDVGTVGMIVALLLKKPLFVRHCGNWFVQRTVAERFWKWTIERFAGGRSVMLATGGASEPPSRRNANVRWVFSTSLRSDQILDAKPRQLNPDGDLRMIIVCRQEEKKGTDVVIASLPLVLKHFPRTTLDVVGGGSLLTSLKQQASFLGLDDRVIFHDKVEQARVVELLRKAHIFCYPTSASEGFPKVVLEALASGVPVIATKVSVLPHLIGSGCGVLLDEATPAALAAAIREICSDDAKYYSMSNKAIEAASEYTLENWRDYIGEVLRDGWKVADLSGTN